MLTRWFTPSSKQIFWNIYEDYSIQWQELTDRLTKCQRLAKPSDNYDDLPAVQNSCHSNGQSHSRDGSYIVVEETSIRKDCIVSQSFDPCSWWKRRSYGGYDKLERVYIDLITLQNLVPKKRNGVQFLITEEWKWLHWRRCDHPRRSRQGKAQFRHNLLYASRTHYTQPRGLQHYHSGYWLEEQEYRLWDDQSAVCKAEKNWRRTMGEKLAKHEGMIRFGVITGKPHIFIHVEGNHILKAIAR